MNSHASTLLVTKLQMSSIPLDKQDGLHAFALLIELQVVAAAAAVVGVVVVGLGDCGGGAGG